VENYRANKNDTCEAIEETEDLDKLGLGFMSADPLEEIDIGDGVTPRPTFIKKDLSANYKNNLVELLREYVDCFAWNYQEMSDLSHDLVEHRLPIKASFRPFKQHARRYNPLMYDRIKEEIDQLLKANFIRPCRYAKWISNIVLVEKEGSGKIRVCIDFWNLNSATPKDEYPMPVANMLIIDALGHKVLSFLDGNVGYNQIFMAEEDMYKAVFRWTSFVGLFEWVVMTFGLKNAGAAYQRAMNLIFYELLSIIVEVYIDDIVVKSASLDSHLVDLRLAFEKTHQYGLKMNPLKCAFGVSASKFLGFIIHEHGIEIDPKQVQAMKKVKALTCKKELQSFLSKVNYLRRFISNLSGRVKAFTPILLLKMVLNLFGDLSNKQHLKKLRSICLRPRFLRRQKWSSFPIICCCWKWCDQSYFDLRNWRKGAYYYLCEPTIIGRGNEVSIYWEIMFFALLCLHYIETLFII
jgi:hypothetical protein